MGFRRIYKTATPYPGAALSEVDYAQTADIVYLVHIDYPLNKLIRHDHDDWEYVEVTLGPLIDPPVGGSGAPTTPNTTGIVYSNYNYVITAVKDSTPAQESRASAIITVSNDLSLSGNYNTLTLPAKPAGVDRYIVYKEQGGAYGYIGGTDGLSFKDQNIQPTLSDTPPIGDNPFDGVGNYPSTVTFHQQRLTLGRTRLVPNGVWQSGSADYENFDTSRPAKLDDAHSFAIVDKRVNAINQIVSQDELLLLTSDSIWSVAGTEGKVMGPGSVDPKKQTNRGVSRLDPIEIDEVTFLQPAKGSSVRTLGFTFEKEGYATNNVTIFSPHLFEGLKIIAWAWQEEPFACIWAVRSDGALLCFTWEAEQQVWGWTLCETNGLFEDIVTISEQGFDRVYATIRRTINGVERLFYERMALPHQSDISTACHLDCSVTQIYDPPQNVIHGLGHLEGETVSAYFDGYASHDHVVEDARIILPNGYEATIATVGLRYTGEVETLPPVLQAQAGSMHTNRQQINEIVVRVIDTKGIKVGAIGTPLEQVEERDGSEVAELPDVDARDYLVPAEGNWADTSGIRIVQDDPFPTHIVGIFYSLNVSPK